MAPPQSVAEIFGSAITSDFVSDRLVLVRLPVPNDNFVWWPAVRYRDAREATEMCNDREFLSSIGFAMCLFFEATQLAEQEGVPPPVFSPVYKLLGCTEGEYEDDPNAQVKPILANMPMMYFHNPNNHAYFREDPVGWETFVRARNQVKELLDLSRGHNKDSWKLPLRFSRGGGSNGGGGGGNGHMYRMIQPAALPARPVDRTLLKAAPAIANSNVAAPVDTSTKVAAAAADANAQMNVAPAKPAPTTTQTAAPPPTAPKGNAAIQSPVKTPAANQENVPPYSPAMKDVHVNCDEPWAQIWNKMNYQGWNRMVGDGDGGDFIYTKPMKSLRGGTEGVDYFTSTRAVQEYVHCVYPHWPVPVAPTLQRPKPAPVAAAATINSKSQQVVVAKPAATVKVPPQKAVKQIPIKGSKPTNKNNRGRNSKKKASRSSTSTIITNVTTTPDNPTRPQDPSKPLPETPSSSSEDPYDFINIWCSLKDHGWKAGSHPLHNWIYLRTGCKSWRDGELGKDWFLEEEEVSEYCRNNNYFRIGCSGRRQEPTNASAVTLNHDNHQQVAVPRPTRRAQPKSFNTTLDITSKQTVRQDKLWWRKEPVPTECQIKPILLKLGIRRHSVDGSFQFPADTKCNFFGMSNLPLIEHLSELRQYLCTKGYPKVTGSKLINDDEQQSLERWISFAYVPETFSSDVEVLGGNRLQVVLTEKARFQCVDNKYYPPGVDKCGFRREGRLEGKHVFHGLESVRDYIRRTASLPFTEDELEHVEDQFADHFPDEYCLLRLWAASSPSSQPTYDVCQEELAHLKEAFPVAEQDQYWATDEEEDESAHESIDSSSKADSSSAGESEAFSSSGNDDSGMEESACEDTLKLNKKSQDVTVKTEPATKKTGRPSKNAKAWWQHEPVPSLETMEPILVKLGIDRNNKGLFVLPGKPMITAIRGESRLRQTLCQEGLPEYEGYPQRRLKEKEKKLLRRWVSFANVPNTIDLKELPHPEDPDFDKTYSTMTRLVDFLCGKVGFQRDADSSGYFPPGIDRISRARTERTVHLLEDIAAVRDYVRNSSRLSLDNNVNDDDLCPDATKLLTLRVWAASSDSALRKYKVQPETYIGETTTNETAPKAVITSKKRKGGPNEEQQPKLRATRQDWWRPETMEQLEIMLSEATARQTGNSSSTVPQRRRCGSPHDMTVQQLQTAVAVRQMLKEMCCSKKNSTPATLLAGYAKKWSLNEGMLENFLTGNALKLVHAQYLKMIEEYFHGLLRVNGKTPPVASPGKIDLCAWKHILQEMMDHAENIEARKSSPPHMSSKLIALAIESCNRLEQEIEGTGKPLEDILEEIAAQFGHSANDIKVFLKGDKMKRVRADILESIGEEWAKRLSGNERAMEVEDTMSKADECSYDDDDVATVAFTQPETDVKPKHDKGKAERAVVTSSMLAEVRNQPEAEGSGRERDDVDMTDNKCEMAVERKDCAMEVIDFADDSNRGSYENITQGNVEKAPVQDSKAIHRSAKVDPPAKRSNMEFEGDVVKDVKESGGIAEQILDSLHDHDANGDWASSSFSVPSPQPSPLHAATQPTVLELSLQEDDQQTSTNPRRVTNFHENGHEYSQVRTSESYLTQDMH